MKPYVNASTGKRIGLALLLCLVLALPGHAAASSKAVQLQRKTADIRLLHQQLGERKSEASALLGELEAQKNVLIDEVRVIAKSSNLASYKEARHHLRIRYNIELLRSLLAYTDAFQAKIRFYEAGHDRLTYFRQLVQDDIKLAATLDVYEIDALTTQISLVINKYLADAHIIRIDPNPEGLLAATQVWDRIMTQKH